jgi:hypothetical protein
MDRIRADQRFNASTRCVALLHHLVGHALQGNHERIKERLLGVEVFGRKPDYDTNSDPIVRLTATQIRKRLERYYQDHKNESAVKIRLVAGNYLPQFEFEDRVRATTDAGAEDELDSARASASEVSNMDSGQETARIILWRKWILAIAAALVVFGVIFAVGRSDLLRSTAFLVWKPFLDSKSDLIVCVPDRNVLSNGNASAGANQQTKSNSIDAPAVAPGTNPTDSLAYVEYMDAGVAYRVGAQLSGFGERSNLRPSSKLTLQDFRGKPIILIGGFNNPWSRVLLSSLRYSLQSDANTGEMWIQDAKDPSKREWKRAAHPVQENADYALITRYFNAETGGWVLAFSGLGPRGTEAAGALLTAPSSVGSLPAILRKAKNFQIVVKVNVINGGSGPPQMLAVSTW